MSIRNPSITYLITSTGRETLKETLRSLYGQFGFGLDKIHIYFDGKCEMGTEYFKEEFYMYPNDLTIDYLTNNLGYWGHGIRNKYQADCTTDYVHNMDDDDIYAEGCIPSIRQQLKDNYGKVLICKFRTLGKRVIWERQGIEFGQVGTPSGFIFNRADVFGTWGYEYGGDYSFYREVEDKIGRENLVFSNTLVVKTRPHVYGY